MQAPPLPPPVRFTLTLEAPEIALLSAFRSQLERETGKTVSRADALREALRRSVAPKQEQGQASS